MSRMEEVDRDSEGAAWLFRFPGFAYNPAAE